MSIRNLVLSTLRATSVEVLFLSCGPATVRRLVIPIWIDAIQGLRLRPFAHICEKVSVRFPPAIADRNTTAPVIAILRAFWVVAAGQHGHPGLVGVGYAVAASVTVSKANGLQVLKAASARLSAAVSKVIGCYFRRAAAIASTQPNDVASAHWTYASDDADRHELTEPSTSQIGGCIAWRRLAGVVFSPTSRQSSSDRSFAHHALNIHCGWSCRNLACTAARTI